MKKITLFLSLCLMTMCNVFAEDIVVWEGNQAGNIHFKPGFTDETGTNYNALMGDAAGQANLQSGDMITVYYTGATAGNKLLVQTSLDGWDNYPQSSIGNSTDLLTAGNGTYVMTINQDFIDLIKQRGLLLRRGGSPTYSFTKVVVTKGGKEEGGGGEGGETTDNIVKIWEGESSTGSLYWAPESAEYNKVFGDGKNQANAQAGDILRFYYKDAAADQQLWVQANWDGVNIDGSTPTLQEGAGSCEFVLTQYAVDLFKTNGIRFRRTNNGNAIYTLTKVEIEKAKVEEGVKKPGTDEEILWEGNENKDYTVSFRYEPNKTTLISKIAVGKYFNLYLSNVEEGDKVYFKECADWSFLNDGDADLVAGRQVFSYEITQTWIDKITAGGMVIQQHDSTGTYDYTFRYLTISNDPKADVDTAISNVAITTTENAAIYNLAGQRVGANAKGLVIINGKKVIK